MNTGIEELERQAMRFQDEIDNLARYLDELTTDGAGYLYDLKQVVGPDSDLGYAISSLGGAVRSAADSAVTRLRETVDIINTKCAEHKQAQQATESQYSDINTKSSGITFQ